MTKSMTVVIGGSSQIGESFARNLSSSMNGTLTTQRVDEDWFWLRLETDMDASDEEFAHTVDEALRDRRYYQRQSAETPKPTLVILDQKQADNHTEAYNRMRRVASIHGNAYSVMSITGSAA